MIWSFLVTYYCWVEGCSKSKRLVVTSYYGIDYSNLMPEKFVVETLSSKITVKQIFILTLKLYKFVLWIITKFSCNFLRFYDLCDTFTFMSRLRVWSFNKKQWHSWWNTCPFINILTNIITIINNQDITFFKYLHSQLNPIFVFFKWYLYFITFHYFSDCHGKN